MNLPDSVLDSIARQAQAMADELGWHGELNANIDHLEEMHRRAVDRRLAIAEQFADHARVLFAHGRTVPAIETRPPMHGEAPTECPVVGCTVPLSQGVHPHA